MFDELERLLTSLRHEEFVYAPNPGNSGDSLIAYATYQLFERLSLHYEVGDFQGVYPGRIVIYGGGGNFVEPYQSANQFVLGNLPVCKLLVILPHTVRSYQDTLSQMGSNCIVFCRERPSFEFVKRHATKATCLLSHDVALSTNIERLRSEAAHTMHSFSSGFNTRLRELKRMLKTLIYGLKNFRSPNTLNAFRTDDERTHVHISSANIDVSYVCARPDTRITVDASRQVAVRMMQFIDRFDTVRTNRLHVGILSAMLGKRVELYDNSYGKIRAVYEHSLRNRFDNVVWHEA